MWWKCPKGDDHEWKTRILNRTSGGSACPKCNPKTSKGEIRILTEMMFLFDHVESRFCINKREIDVFIPSIKVGIEYDGWYFHRGRETKDEEKAVFLKSKGIRMIRVREKPLQIITKNDISFEGKHITKELVNTIVEKIGSFVPECESEYILDYISKKKFQNSSIYKKYLSYLPNPFPENSLELKYPILCNEWDYEANYPLTPKNFSHGSSHKVWWLCSKNKSHKWDAIISGRTIKKSGCPYCSGAKVNEKNRLDKKFPKLLCEWDKEKNENLKPEQISYGSTREVWWKCSICNKVSWRQSPNSRTQRKILLGCKNCKE